MIFHNIHKILLTFPKKQLSLFFQYDPVTRKPSTFSTFSTSLGFKTTGLLTLF